MDEIASYVLEKVGKTTFTSPKAADKATTDKTTDFASLRQRLRHLDPDI